MKSLRLHNQICAFIDVLGGAQLFLGKERERAASFFACVDEFERRMNGWSHHFPKKRQASGLVKTFSDNIFAAFPLKSNSSMSDHDVVDIFLSELKHQIYELTILAGFPVRGAVSLGPLMFTDKFLFGPALVEAVQLEKAAVFPRVLLTESVLRLVEPGSVSSEIILKDADGHVFLDYLGKIFSPTGVLERHKQYIERGLLENASRVHERQKYEWLAQYHNYKASSYERPDLSVCIEHASAFSSYTCKAT